MADFLILNHDDGGGHRDWAPYLTKLREAGVLRGGSAIGRGACVRKNGPDEPITRHIVGFIRIEAADFETARALLAGHPLYEAGGLVEIRELPRTD